jgi:UDP-2,3-diacylglucosamine hydrolase
MTAFFISDLHLPPQGGEVRAQFEYFTATLPVAGDSLYLLGDLFEYWAGDDDIDAPGNRRVVDRLANCAMRGVALYWIAGNRDFLAGPGFAQAAHMTVLPDPFVFDLCGERTVLLHGDTLCTDDRAYQAFRSESRSECWKRDFLGRPLELRRREIEAMRSQSEHEKALKAPEIMDVNAAAVTQLFSATGATRMIHGHTHRPACHEYVLSGRVHRRFVLPAWESQPGCLRVDARGARAENLA